MRQWTFEFALLSIAASACGGSSGEATSSSTSALSSGAPILCQDECDTDDAALKLVSTGGSFCSGTFIGSKRVLTSAKCITDIGLTPNLCITSRVLDARCDVGQPMNNKSISEQYLVRRTYVHPSFAGVAGGGFDAAVIVLDREITPYSDAHQFPPKTPLPIDDQPFPDGTQGAVFGFGTNSNPSVSGQKQVLSDVPSVASSFPNYIALQATGFRAGDFGGGFISGFNLVAGINSFVQNGLSFMTRTQPIRNWIQTNSASVPTCNLSGEYIYSSIAGKCLEAGAIGTTTVSLNYCQCISAQRWNQAPTPTAGQKFTNVGTGRCLQGFAQGPVGQDTCSSSPSQDWAVGGSLAMTQLTVRGNGTVLLTANMKTTAMGISSPMRWWQLIP